MEEQANYIRINRSGSIREKEKGQINIVKKKL